MGKGEPPGRGAGRRGQACIRPQRQQRQHRQQRQQSQQLWHSRAGKAHVHTGMAAGAASSSACAPWLEPQQKEAVGEGQQQQAGTQDIYAGPQSHPCGGGPALLLRRRHQGGGLSAPGYTACRRCLCCQLRCQLPLCEPLLCTSLQLSCCTGVHVSLNRGNDCIIGVGRPACRPRPAPPRSCGNPPMRAATGDGCAKCLERAGPAISIGQA